MDRRGHLVALDGVRFGCALAVLGYHLWTVFPLAASSVMRDFDTALRLPTSLARYSWWGWVGVELFFVVSGYVIAISAAAVGPASFFRRRALRLLPAVWICASLTAAVLAVGSSLPGATIAANWARSMVLSPLGQPIDEIYWTLGVEVAFYALVAMVIRGGCDNRSRLTMLGAALAGVSLLFWAGEGSGLVTADPAATPVRLLLLPHGGCFAVGIALRTLAERGAGRAVWLTLGGGLIASGCEIVAMTATMTGVAGFDPNPIVPLAIFALGVAVIAAAPRLGGAGSPTLAAMGAMTYPLYLLNQRFAAGVLTGFAHRELPVGLAVTGAAAIVVALAWTIADHIEPALRNRLAGRLSPPRPHVLRANTLPTASLPAG